MIGFGELTAFEITSLLTNIFVCAGVIFAALSYRSTQKKQQKNEEEQAFLQSDEAFIRINRIMMRHIDLPLSYYHENIDIEKLSKTEKIQCYLYFEILTSALERVFTMFQSVSPAKYNDEWPGWDRYVGYQCRNNLYYEWWSSEDRGYGTAFSEYMTGKMGKAPRE